MEYTILLLVLPFVSFLVLGIAGMKLRPAVAGAVGTAVLAVVTAVSYFAAWEYFFGIGRDAAGLYPTLVPWNTVWLPISDALHIDLGILLDPISVMMLVVISTVSLMVHIYSLGYMKGERGFQRYYAFLSLFTMSMTGLVVATNIFQMYLFWELVGVSSYLLIPDFMGSDSARAFSEDGPVAAALTPYGMAQAAQQLPAYWGEQPYTGGPTYLGAAALFLALLGALLVGGRDRWWIVAASLVMLLLAWGHHFMGLTELAYKYLPGYNKFRTVSMALVVVQWTVPLLAALALQRLWCAELPAVRLRRALAWAAGVTGGLCLLFAVAGGQLFDFGREAAVEQMTAQFNRILQANGADDLLRQGLDATIGEEVGAAMADERAAMMTADAWRSLLFVLLTAAAVGLMIVRPAWRGAAVALAGVLVAADLWGVDVRYLSSDDFVSPRRQQWTPSGADKLILGDTTPGFRVLNLTVSPFNDATTSYYHRSVGGYHGAKMSRYQDVIDRYLSSNDEAVLDMLNTRYLILPGADGRPEAHLRATAQGAAWLVSDVVTASTPQQELAALATADLRRQAVVNPADYARMTGAREGALPAVDTLGGTIRLTEYRPNYLKYEYASAAPATAVFSEIFYDKGWTAWVDGVETPYFRADYLLRALELPAGDHTVEWRFRAPHWGAVEGVTGLCSAAILLLIAGLAAAEWYKRKKR